MPAPTSEDAHIYLQLLDMVQQPHLAAASEWVLSEFEAAGYRELEQKYPRGSAERSHLVSVLGFYESVGALVSHGLLHEDLFFDAPFMFELVWPRVEPLILDWQKSSKDPSVWENVVWLARRSESWRASTWRLKSEAIPTDRPPSKQWGETQGHVGFTKG
ncbi:MAG TPA: DUF4760 domain-containing protein [Candidatus Dormibacteraeota bacterium]|nr:DUF4760 domain-containing protein [Candidatus Dormibacteraeota bacterium]